MLPESRKDGLLLQEVGDELVIYDQMSHHVHRLNQTAAFIWRHCDGHRDVPTLAALLRSWLGLPADANLVKLAIRRLGAAELLTQSLSKCMEVNQITRRQVLRQLSIAGPLTFLLPVVATILAPVPSFAASRSVFCTGSCPPPGGCPHYAVCPDPPPLHTRTEVNCSRPSCTTTDSECAISSGPGVRCFCNLIFAGVACQCSQGHNIGWSGNARCECRSEYRLAAKKGTILEVVLKTNRCGQSMQWLLGIDEQTQRLSSCFLMPV
jgi:hypothetical protein